MVMTQVEFDPEQFTETASLFVKKRQTFSPDAVEQLAGDVLRQLAAVGRQTGSMDNPVISTERIDAFCEALIAPSTETALRFIEERRAEGLTRMGVYLGYICAAARRLGEGWDNDEYSFLDVTTGTGHLYALMRALRAEAEDERGPADTRRSALFATVPGEDHGIGITVAADVFRERGWEIDLQIGCDHETLLEYVERKKPRIIGLSLTTEARFDALARIVVAMRIAAPHATIGVAGGEGVDSSDLPRLVDIDLVFDSAVGACDSLETLIAPRC